LYRSGFVEHKTKKEHKTFLEIWLIFVINKGIEHLRVNYQYGIEASHVKIDAEVNVYVERSLSSAGLYLSSPFFWDVTPRRCVIGCRRLETT